MIRKCKFFECKNKENCSKWNVNCSGCGGVGYQKCGCDLCINQSLEGEDDVEVCEVALSMLEANMEESETMNTRFIRNGELEDEKIVEALREAAKWYEDGAIAEVRDLLGEIVDAINAFDNRYDG